MELVVDGVDAVVEGKRVRTAAPATVSWEGTTLRVAPPHEPDFTDARMRITSPNSVDMSMRVMGVVWVQADMRVLLNGYNVSGALGDAGLLPCSIEVLDGRLHANGRPFSLARPADVEAEGAVRELSVVCARVSLLDEVRTAKITLGEGADVRLRRAGSLTVNAAVDARIRIGRVDRLVARTWGDAIIDCRRARLEARATARGGRIEVGAEEGARVRQRDAGGTVGVRLCGPLGRPAHRRGRPPGG